MRWELMMLVGLCVGLAGAGGESAQGGGGALADPLADIPSGPHVVRLESVASGLVFPTNVAAPPDGSGRLFVTEVNGVVRVIEGGAVQPVPFVDLSARYHGSNGSAMSGLAFHPDFASNRRLYVILTEQEDVALADFGELSGVAQQSVLYELVTQADHPDPGASLADPAFTRELLRINEQSTIHNLDDLAFGSDGYLYMSKGDDETGGQDLAQIHGSVLRIDVDFGVGNAVSANGEYAIPADNPFVGVGGVVEEIWAYGFRNPWRIAFDAVTDELWVADVGEDDIEELGRVAAGENHGWNAKEGAFAVVTGGVSDDLGGLPPGPFVDPVVQYDHGQGDRSVTGGGVYRGVRLPGLAGRLVFGDWISGRLFEADPATGDITRIAIDPDGELVHGQLSGDPKEGIISVAHDGDGELLLVVTERNGNPTGRVLRAVAENWVDLGNGLAGTHGLPVLAAWGTLVAGEPLSVSLTNALSDTTAELIVGFTELNAPFKGGVMVPDFHAPGFHLPLPTGPAGTIVIDDTWPAGVPSGFTTYLQYWVVDPAGPSGFAASQAVAGTTP